MLQNNRCISYLQIFLLPAFCWPLLMKVTGEKTLDHCSSRRRHICTFRTRTTRHGRYPRQPLYTENGKNTENCDSFWADIRNVAFATHIICQIQLSPCLHDELPPLFNVCIYTTLFLPFTPHDQRLKMVPQKYDYANLLFEESTYQLIPSVPTLMDSSITD